MHVVLVDDNELLAKGRADELRRTGHSALVLGFEQALVLDAAEWTAAASAVVDASDVRAEARRRLAREATGARYEPSETFLGLRVVRRIRELSPRTVVLVVTAYAEAGSGDPHVVEAFVQAGAHYVLPHSDVHDGRDFVAEIEHPHPDHAAAPLPAGQRRALGLRHDPGRGQDLLDALDLVLAAPDAARRYLVEGDPMSHRAVKPHEREVRRTRRAVEAVLLRDQSNGKAAPLIRGLLRHLLPPRRDPPDGVPM